MANLLVPAEIGLAGGVAPLEGEDGHRVAAVGGLVGLDMAIQMEDVAHLVMADSRITPAGVCHFAKAWTVTPEAIVADIAG